jgi:hypothetical protein
VQENAMSGIIARGIGFPIRTFCFVAPRSSIQNSSPLYESDTPKRSAPPDLSPSGIVRHVFHTKRFNLSVVLMAVFLKNSVTGESTA